MPQAQALQLPTQIQTETYLQLGWFDTRVALCYQSIGMSQDKLEQAWQLLQEAYQAQIEGDYAHAVELYEKSLAVQPTAEAHSFLGWTYHFQGRLEEEIGRASCRERV